MGLMGMSVAAVRLGVSVRQVQRLVKSGDVVSVGVDRVDAESVYRLQRERAGHRRRAWEEATAWGAIGLLSGVQVDWVGQAQRSRLKARLRLIEADVLVSAVRNRAIVHRFTAHRAAVTGLEQQLVASGGRAAFGDLTAATSTGVDGYIATTDLDRLVDEFVLATDGAGDVDVTVRTTSFDFAIVVAIAATGDTLAAVDLATSLDSRERAAGLGILTGQLEAFA